MSLHLRDDIERLYMSRKEGGRGFARFKDSMDVSIRELNKKEQRKINYSD